MDLMNEKFTNLDNVCAKIEKNGSLPDAIIQELATFVEDLKKLCKQIKLSQESYKTAYNDQSNRLQYISENIGCPKALNDQFQDTALKRFIEDLLLEIERLKEIINDGEHKKEFTQLCKDNENLKKEITLLKEQLTIRFKEQQAINRKNETDNIRLQRESTLAKCKSENAQLKEKFLMFGSISNQVKSLFDNMAKDMVIEFEKLSNNYSPSEVSEAAEELKYGNIPPAFRKPLSRPVASASLKPGLDDRVDSGIASMDDERISEFKTAALEENKKLLEEKDKLCSENKYLKQEILKYQSSQAIRDVINQQLRPYKEEMEKLRQENQSLRQRQSLDKLSREKEDLENQVATLTRLLSEAEISHDNDSAPWSRSNRELSDRPRETDATNQWGERGNSASLPSFPRQQTPTDYRRVVSDNSPSMVFTSNQLSRAMVPEPYQSISMTSTLDYNRRPVLAADGGRSSTEPSPEESPDTSPTSSPKTTPRRDSKQ